ncbi:Ribosomal RNA large subunit methyltransferase H [BD1-7 clade bacterium]|uniref:Ribosomal RNA large subunit methyltransferase H n=1 Tax=BD1-7 clade bacterium TaxID=2029982 RepID=A0A5S9PVU1_9GAMM|nr:Ribosomal RNA large subunit methyltransferase H [BD1-7 clade bacterium]CAA0108961.1 Ribosomal RNA large subunit methyltransferase H [BD1-7 clade bacterium]
MRVRLIAVGQKMPAWVTQAYTDYAKRINGDVQLSLVELPMQKRGKNVNTEQLAEKEGKAILDAIAPQERVVALDVLGKPISTPDLADNIKQWQMDGRNVAIIIGGPDGLSQAVLQRADQKISLSKLTLPHPMVRVLVSEQLYRAWSINHGHPYHR